MSTRSDYVNLIIKLLNEVPQKYNDRNKEILYHHGFLIGALSEMMIEDSQIAHTVTTALKNASKK